MWCFTGFKTSPNYCLMYINDSHTAWKQSLPTLVTDDTNLSWVDNDLDDMQTLISEELTEIAPWLKANKLSVNIKKTRYMLLRNRGVTGKDMCLEIDNEVVKQVKKKQFLFVIIGWNLTRKEHISYISAGLLNGWEFYLKPESTWIKPH